MKRPSPSRPLSWQARWQAGKPLPKAFYYSLPTSLDMAEFIFLDKFGRMVLPKRLREELGASAFSAEVKGRRLLLEPLLSLEELAGSVPELDRKKLLAEHEEEVRREAHR